MSLRLQRRSALPRSIRRQRHPPRSGVGSRVFPVADMTGDGGEEIIGVHPDTMSIEWRASDANYAYSASNVWTIGDPTAIFL